MTFTLSNINNLVSLPGPAPAHLCWSHISYSWSPALTTGCWS